MRVEIHETKLSLILFYGVCSIILYYSTFYSIIHALFAEESHSENRRETFAFPVSRFHVFYDSIEFLSRKTKMINDTRARARARTHTHTHKIIGVQSFNDKS